MTRRTRCSTRCRGDVVQADVALRPVGDCLGDELGTVVAPRHGGLPTGRNKAVQFVDEFVTGDRTLHETAEALTGVLVHDRCDLDGAPVFVGLEMKIDPPHYVRARRRRGVHRGGADSFATPLQRVPEAFHPPQALHPLLVPRLPLGTGVTNPKTLVFVAAVLPQFVDPAAGPAWAQILLLGLLFAAIALVSDGAYALAASGARGWLARSPRRLERMRAAGGVMIASLGVVLMASRRVA